MKGKLLNIKTLVDPPKYEIFPYIQKPLLTNVEKEFYKALEIALEDKFFILHQIGLNRLLEKANHIDYKDWKFNYFNKIKAKSIDFAICSKDDFSILLIIELDGATHYKFNRKERDNFVNNTLTEAGYNVLRLETQKEYNPQKLKELIYRNFNLKEKEILELKEEKTSNENTIKNLNELAIKLEYHNTKKKCTTAGCYGVMKVRTSKDSKKYWVCSEYNKCKTAVAVEEAGA